MANQPSRAEKRAARQAAFQDRKAKAARTPWHQMNTAWDQFRQLAWDLPEEFRDEVADRMTTHLNQQIWDLRRR